MQQLHLVGVTTDHDSLIFSVRRGAKSGSFVLPLDEQLLAALADAVRQRNASGVELEVPVELASPTPAPRRQSQLSPREIQARLRAGRTLEQIAAEAGVGEEWVSRFAAPVEAERSQVVRRARELVYSKPRRGDSGEPLGFSLRWNLSDRGVRLTDDEFDGAWSAFQVADETWMVTFTFVSRKRTQEAAWEVDLETGHLIARNRLASDLGYVEHGRRKRTESSFQPTPPPAARRRTRSAEDAADADAPDETGEATTRAARGARPQPKRAPQGAAKRAKARPAAAVAKRATATGAAATRKKAAPPPAAPKRKVAAPARAGAAKRATPAPAATKKKVAPRKTAPSVAAPIRAAKKATTAATRRAVKKPPVPAAGAKRARATKATQKRATGRSSERGAPPATAVPPARVAETSARPVPNELGRRRMQLAMADAGTAAAGRTASAPAAGRARPAGARDARPPVGPSVGTPGGRPHGEPAASPAGGRPAAETFPVDRDRERRAAAGPTGRTRPSRPADVERPSGGDGGQGEGSGTAAAADLDVPGEGADADVRRAERRRTRADARRAATSGPVAAGSARSAGSAPIPDRPTPDLPPGDGRVVQIRANRATPPTTETEAEVVLPPDRPPLRPAQPAALPRRRRFARPDR